VRSHDLTLELERIVSAPAAEVFAAFTDPERLAAWWGPEGFSVPAVDFAPRVGEAYRIEMQPPEGEAFQLVGAFREVDPPARLAFTFRWEPPAADDVETLVDLTFTDLDGSTKVVLTQGEFSTRGRWELHRDGWTQSFERLERIL
jgi:uncharacterized protein YndB with AHSA1/START domain